MKTNKKGYKEVGLNVVGEELKAEARKQLDTEHGIKLKVMRSEQAEGAFAAIKEDMGFDKEDMGFDRFHRRGLKTVKMEFLMVCLGYNLRKYHSWRLRRMAAVPHNMMS